MPKNKIHIRKKQQTRQIAVKNDVSYCDPNDLQLEFDAIFIAIDDEMSKKGLFDLVGALSVSYSYTDILKCILTGGGCLFAIYHALTTPTDDARMAGAFCLLPLTLACVNMTNYARMPLSGLTTSQKSVHAFLSKMRGLGFLTKINESSSIYDFMAQTSAAIKELRVVKTKAIEVITKEIVKGSEAGRQLLIKGSQLGLFAKTPTKEQQQDQATVTNNMAKEKRYC